MSDWFDYCLYCDEEIERKIQTDVQKFCCEEHRIKYHNLQRKIDRKKTAILKAISDLHDMIEDTSCKGLHAGIARDLRYLSLSVLDNGGRSVWATCNNCYNDYRVNNNLDGCPTCQDRGIFDAKIYNSIKQSWSDNRNKYNYR